MSDQLLLDGTFLPDACCQWPAIAGLHGGDDERAHLFGRTYCGHHGHPFVLWPALSAMVVMSDTFDRPVVPVRTPRVQWGPVVAGALSAAALATVLNVFGGAI